MEIVVGLEFFFASRRRHTIFTSDWSSDVCSSDLAQDVDIVCFPELCVCGYNTSGNPPKAEAEPLGRDRKSVV